MSQIPESSPSARALETMVSREPLTPPPGYGGQNIPPKAVSGVLAADMLREASTIVAGARNASHGDKERSFAAIAALWNAYLGNRKCAEGEPISPEDVCLMMVLMKMMRARQGTPIRDHYVDMAGYAAIAGEVALLPTTVSP